MILKLSPETVAKIKAGSGIETDQNGDYIFYIDRARFSVCDEIAEIHDFCFSADRDGVAIQVDGQLIIKPKAANMAIAAVENY